MQPKQRRFNMKEYKKRIADKLLEYRLEEVGAVLIEGPKWCGKTTTAEQKAKSVLYMADPDNQNNYLEMANLKIKMLLKGEKPRLIDEWQIIPQIWDAIRFEVDHQGEEGLFILTGSAVPASSEKYITRVQDVSPGLPCALCHYGNRENLQAKLASANCSREMQTWKVSTN